MSSPALTATTVQTPPKQPRTSNAGWWVMGAGALLTGGGAVLGAHPWIDTQTLDTGIGSPGNYHDITEDQAKDAKRFATVGVIGMGLGAAVLLTGAIIQATR